VRKPDDVEYWDIGSELARRSAACPSLQRWEAYVEEVV
jgi:hypothetical protein